MDGMRPGLLALAVLASSSLVFGCARASTPEGGPVPESPLQITETEPRAESLVRPFDGPVRIEFQRRVSERPSTGTLRDGVVVSPRTGSVEVQHQRRGLEIRMEGGFREATIYRITVLPVFQDLFQNRMAAPVDLFFSTGPEFEPNILGGLVVDRLTGQEAPRVRVDARTLEEGPVHSTVTDSTGIFTFPYLPAGEYLVVAYDDRNRNRSPDFAEPQDSMEVSLARGDTVIVTELALLPRDTTAAVVQSASVVDSVTVRVTFDDHLDPEEPLDPVTAHLFREVGDAPEVTEILHLHEWEARVEAQRREQERREAEEDPDAPVDPLPEGVPQPAPVAPPAPDEPEPEEPDPAGPDPVLPSQDLVLILRSPLEAGAVYTLELGEVRNIQGVPGGGGEVEVEVPEEPEEEPPDPEEDPPDFDDDPPDPDEDPP